MKHRNRYRVAGLASHTTPNGVSKMGEEEILRKKFNRGDITPQELRKYTAFLLLGRKRQVSTHTTIVVWGKRIEVSIEDFNQHCSNF